MSKSGLFLYDEYPQHVKGFRYPPIRGIALFDALPEDPPGYWIGVHSTPIIVKGPNLIGEKADLLQAFPS